HTLAVPIDQPTERLEVLIEDSTATASDDLAPDDPVNIEGRAFRRYSADSIAAGASPSVNFIGIGSRGRRNYTWMIVAVAGLVLVGIAAFATRKRSRRADPVAAPESFAGAGAVSGQPLQTASDASPELSGESTE